MNFEVLVKVVSELAFNVILQGVSQELKTKERAIIRLSSLQWLLSAPGPHSQQ